MNSWLDGRCSKIITCVSYGVVAVGVHWENDSGLCSVVDIFETQLNRLRRLEKQPRFAILATLISLLKSVAVAIVLIQSSSNLLKTIANSSASVSASRLDMMTSTLNSHWTTQSTLDLLENMDRAVHFNILRQICWDLGLLGWKPNSHSGFWSLKVGQALAEVGSPNTNVSPHVEPIPICNVNVPTGLRELGIIGTNKF